MARDVTLRATYSDDLVGDETYELWLQHDTDAWVLYVTDEVDPDVNNQQLIVLLTLIEDDPYVAQIRLRREGRYRVGYLTADPDTWPESSRCEFVPGALIGADAPVITAGVWSRTSGVATKIALTITPDVLDKDLRIFRDGVSIGVVSQPLANPTLFDDDDPPIAEEHVYTAAHTAGFLDGPESADFPVFAGPLPPEDFDQTSPDHTFGLYDVGWDADGDPVRIQDDFLCTGFFNTQIAGTTGSTFERNVEDHVIPIGGTAHATFVARIRREVESFSVVDVSDWVETPIECDIEDTNTDYNSCP